MAWREIVAPAALEPDHSLRMRVFLTRLEGRPAISGELARLRWWDRDDPSRLAPAIEHEVVPRLRAGGLLD